MRTKDAKEVVEVRDHLHTARWMMMSMMQRLVEEKIRRNQGDADWHKDKILIFRFRVKDTRKVHEVVVWAPSNYIGVYDRVVEITPVSREVDLRPDRGWVLRGYHDSCWRGAMENAIRENQDTYSGFDFEPWAVLGVSEDAQMFLRSLIKEQDNRWKNK